MTKLIDIWLSSVSMVGAPPPPPPTTEAPEDDDNQVIEIAESPVEPQQSYREMYNPRRSLRSHSKGVIQGDCCLSPMSSTNQNVFAEATVHATEKTVAMTRDDGRDESNEDAAPAMPFAANASGDLDLCEVRVSNIEGAGIGLFATSLIKKGQRITKFSGSPIPTKVARKSKSKYLLYVNNKKSLDAAGPGHMVGRYMNEGSISGLKNNARFGASLRTYKCKITGREYVSVFATRDIHPDEEVLCDYGKEISWSYAESVESKASDNDSDSDYTNSDDDEDPDDDSDTDFVEDREFVDPPSDDGDDSDDGCKKESPPESTDSPPVDEVSIDPFALDPFENYVYVDDPPNYRTLYDKDGDPFKVPLSYAAMEDFFDSDDPDYNPFYPSPTLQEEFQKEWQQNLDLNKRADSDLADGNHQQIASEWIENFNNAIEKAAEATLPDKEPSKLPSRGTSERTKSLFETREGMTKGNSSKAQFKDIQDQIKESCLNDYQDWVSSCVAEMEKAERVGNTAKIYHVVKRLASKPTPGN